MPNVFYPADEVLPHLVQPENGYFDHSVVNPLFNEPVVDRAELHVPLVILSDAACADCHVLIRLYIVELHDLVLVRVSLTVQVAEFVLHARVVTHLLDELYHRHVQGVVLRLVTDVLLVVDHRDYRYVKIKYYFKY